jgi:outer membrane protein OmpA-like peptidoglycan-associated protein
MLVLVALLALAGIHAANGQEPALTPVDQRMTDEAQYHDHTVYQSTEVRLKSLNDAGHKLSDYEMAKAQCWVDVSFHEYTNNDRSEFPALALQQAQGIIEQLENHATPISRDTPLINGADRLRPDLWARLEEIKHSPQIECAAQPVACAEVELVHAGNENKDFGWRAANPYIGMAEQFVGEANQAVSACQPPPPPPPMITQAVVPPVAADLVRVSLRADTLFAFKSAALTKEGRATLDHLIAQLPAGQPVGGIAVAGYTDRIDVHHNPENNQRLSEARATTVATYLGHHGIPEAKITSYGRGSANPVVACDEVPAKAKAQLYACLAPNRRVEVVVSAMAQATPK